MYDSLESIQALIGVEAETVSLEFKDGAKLTGLTDRARTELVTDVTAFANAGGGTLIYGVREEQREGRSVATAIAPVTDAQVTQDRLRDIVHSNTDPALKGFTITPIDAEGGLIFVIDIEEGDTAYQNKRDFKFYSRVDASAHPMHGFAVRDVMNRRTHPHVGVSFEFLRDETNAHRHQYTVVPVLKNEGHLTANHWMLRLGLPDVIGRPDGRLERHIREISGSRIDGQRFRWFEYSSEQNTGENQRILPGDSLKLSAQNNYGHMILVIASEQEIRQAVDAAPPLVWSLLLDNAPKQAGSVPYGEWSIW